MISRGPSLETPYTSNIARIEGLTGPSTVSVSGSGGSPWSLNEVIHRSENVFGLNSIDTSSLGLAFDNDGTKMYFLGSVNDKIYQYRLVIPWDINSAIYETESAALTGVDATPRGIAFNSDGTKAYLTGTTNGFVYQYSLSTAWDVSTATYDSISLNLNGQDSTPAAIEFRTDGSKFYIVGMDNDSIYQYSMSTPWDLSTASYDSVAFNFTGEDGNVLSAHFSDDGSQLVMLGSASDTIYQYVLSTPWDISTLAYTGTSFFVGSEDDSPTDIKYSSDEDKIFLLGGFYDSVFSYDLATSADIGSASFPNRARVSFAGQTQIPNSISMSSDGTKVYITASLSDVGFQYELSTAWDLSTATYQGKFFDFTTQVPGLVELQFSSDGSKVYALDSSSDAIFQYTLSPSWDLSTASYDTVSFPLSGQDSATTNFYFRSDGLKIYVVGDFNNTIYQYSLSTPWDLSTTSYDSVSFSISAQTTSPKGIEFSSTGDKAFVGHTEGLILQYSLSTPWDLSSMSFDFLVSTEDQGDTEDLVLSPSGDFIAILSNSNQYAVQGQLATAWDASLCANSIWKPSGLVLPQTVPDWIEFGSNGTKMYLLSSTTNTVQQYSLSTAWDSKSATYDTVVFNPTTEEPDPICFAIRPDGLKAYVLGATGDEVFQYTLSTAWDLSTASYDSVVSPVSAGTYRGCYFKPDGSSFYAVESVTDQLRQFDLGTNWDVTTLSSTAAAVMSVETTTGFYVSFSSDGRRVFTAQNLGTPNIYQYELSTPWDLTTAGSYTQVGQF